MVEASTRRLPSTTIELELCAKPTTAGIIVGQTPKIVPPKTKPATLSLRKNHVTKFIRNAPSTPIGRLRQMDRPTPLEANRFYSLWLLLQANPLPAFSFSHKALPL